MGDSMLVKILIAIFLFGLMQMFLLMSRTVDMSDQKLSLEAEVDMLLRKKDLLTKKIMDLERGKHRMELKIEKMDFQVRDVQSLARNRKNLPTIFFVTPTGPRLEQKADLVRLAQTLSHIPNLYWVVVEDADEPSTWIKGILERSKLSYVHLAILTPLKMKLKDTDPNWKLPRGVVQRNTALRWIRTNFGSLKKGVIYFGDDDNTYDWRLFEEIRNINKAGVWPVGLVGSRIVETPILSNNGNIIGFNSIWKQERPFPIDMASFSVNITLVVQKPHAEFTYNVPRGYQESHFLTELGLSKEDLEPKANLCSQVYVWHTRTEKSKLLPNDRQKYLDKTGLSYAEIDAIQ